MAEEKPKTKIDQVLEWMDKSDYYQVLNVPREANSGQFKTAYYQLSQQYHPDKCQSFPFKMHEY